MRHGDHLYRRPSGYYVRVVVPPHLRTAVGKREIHRSLRTNDYGKARLRSLTALHDIKIYFAELHQMDINKLTTPSPLLLGAGELSLKTVAEIIGLSPGELIEELRRQPPPLVVHLNRVEAYVLSESDVDAMHEDGAIEDGAFVMNYIERRFEITRFTDYASPLEDRKSILAAALTTPEYSGALKTSGGRTVILVEPIELPFDVLRISRSAAERLRRNLAATLTNEMVLAAKAATPIAPQKASNLHATAKPIRITDFRAQWLELKERQAPSTHNKDQRETAPFLELIGNPYLHEIDDEIIEQYRSQLRRLPQKLQVLRRGDNPPPLVELIAKADLENLPRMQDSRADAYISQLGKLLRYAVAKNKIIHNPCARVTISIAGASTDDPTKKTDSQKRLPFDESELSKIFGVQWFQTGKGTKTKKDTYLFYQPNYYWVPLLLSYSGARCNEVCQLLVSDIRQSPSGAWYLDFNLEGPEKIDVQDDDDEIDFDGKRFKTTNSLRGVPIHHHLIKLGFIDYLNALRAAGHIYLFADLRFDKIKGRGKAFGQWFNERFLGNGLGIPRDGTKTAYSLRHLFATRLGHVFPNDDGTAIQAELLGHQRGKSQAKKVYDKGRGAERLAPYLNKLELPELAHIAPFDVVEGMAALRDALRRKDEKKKRDAPQST